MQELAAAERDAKRLRNKRNRSKRSSTMDDIHAASTVKLPWNFRPKKETAIVIPSKDFESMEHEKSTHNGAPRRAMRRASTAMDGASRERRRWSILGSAGCAMDSTPRPSQRRTSILTSLASPKGSRRRCSIGASPKGCWRRCSTGASPRGGRRRSIIFPLAPSE